MGVFSPTFCIFGQKFSDKKKIFDNFLQPKMGIRAIALFLPCHDASVSVCGQPSQAEHFEY